MSLASETVNNSAIDNLVQSSLESENINLRLKWISCSAVADIKPVQIDNVFYARDARDRYDDKIILVLLGSSEECTPIKI